MPIKNRLVNEPLFIKNLKFSKNNEVLSGNQNQKIQIFDSKPRFRAGSRNSENADQVPIPVPQYSRIEYKLMIITRGYYYSESKYLEVTYTLVSKSDLLRFGVSGAS